MRETQTDRHTDTERQTDTDRQKDTHTHTEAKQKPITNNNAINCQSIIDNY